MKFGPGSWRPGPSACRITQHRRVFHSGCSRVALKVLKMLKVLKVLNFSGDRRGNIFTIFCASRAAERRVW